MRQDLSCVKHTTMHNCIARSSTVSANAQKLPFRIWRCNNMRFSRLASILDRWPSTGDGTIRFDYSNRLVADTQARGLNVGQDRNRSLTDAEGSSRRA